MSEENVSVTTTVEEVPEVYNPGDTVRASWNMRTDRCREAMQSKGYALEVQETMLALLLWCIDERHPVRRAHVADELGCSQNLIYQILTGIYEKPTKALMEKIRVWLAGEQRKFGLSKDDFIISATAEKCFLACNLARTRRKPVILAGPSQIGKTEALRYDRAQNNHGKTFMAELDAASGHGGMVRTIAKACGLSPKRNTADLIESLRRILTPDTVLIIDEMHLLKHTYRLNSFFACVETIRRTWDFCQCGMVLSWTNLKDLENSSQDELVQAWRRSIYKVVLPEMPTKADIKAFLKHYGLDFPTKELQIVIPGKNQIVEKPYEVLRQVAGRDGIGAINERLIQARLSAEEEGKRAITWHHFLDAHLKIEKLAEAEPRWS
jgi:DNA transposition AAA+ family ATPase